MNPLQGLIDLIGGFTKPNTYTFDFRESKRSPAAQSNLPLNHPSRAAELAQYLKNTQEEQTPATNNIAADVLRQNISNTWGKDTPLLKELDLYLQAGEKLPANVDRLLPIALALRETQGGKDLINPAKNSKLGDNNVFNIRNNTGEFQDYPDLATAILGNIEQGGESGGLVGLLGGTKPSSANIYADFRKTGDYKDLFKRWSPPTDNNGSLDEQTQNIQWILNQLKKR